MANRKQTVIEDISHTTIRLKKYFSLKFYFSRKNNKLPKSLELTEKN